METLFNFFLYTYNGKSHFKKVIYSRLLDILCKMEIITQKQHTLQYNLQLYTNMTCYQNFNKSGFVHSLFLQQKM